VRRLAAIVVGMALVIAGAAAPASGGAVKRSASSAVTKHRPCPKPSQRARRSCRRARVSAGLRRGPARGRARLVPRASRPAATTGTGVAAPTLGLPGQAPAPAGDPAAPGTIDPPAPVASTIGAEAYDFGTFVLRLTKPSVPAGDLTIYFHNNDVSDHNLWIQPPPSVGVPTQISEAVGENGGATKTVAVSPGTWRLYCSLPGHEAMTRDLVVQ
jgi:plastocyanin